MRHLSTGMWWLAFFPGLLLLVIVMGFDILGDNLRMSLILIVLTSRADPANNVQEVIKMCLALPLIN